MPASTVLSIFERTIPQIRQGLHTFERLLQNDYFRTLSDLRVLVNRVVKMRILFRLIIEPQAWTNLLHVEALPSDSNLLRSDLAGLRCFSVRRGPGERSPRGHGSAAG